MARPASAAQESRACALVPCMSDLNPPSQNRPGAAPPRCRTAMERTASSVPTVRNSRDDSVIEDFILVAVLLPIVPIVLDSPYRASESKSAVTTVLRPPARRRQDHRQFGTRA